METLRDNEKRILCPYNPAHHIFVGRFETHLKKCRAQYRAQHADDKQSLVTCDFNASHVILEPELQYHHDTCPDRKVLELSVFEESSIRPIVNPIPAIPVPVDSSWDDDEPRQSYNPQKYCEENKVVRRIDTMPAAVRREFRDSERYRFSNLDKGSKYVAPGLKEANRPTGTRPKQKPVQFPPTPAFSQRNFENTPEDVSRLLEQLSVAPKKAIIPKAK